MQHTWFLGWSGPSTHEPFLWVVALTTVSVWRASNRFDVSKERKSANRLFFLAAFFFFFLVVIFILNRRFFFSPSTFILLGRNILEPTLFHCYAKVPFDCSYLSLFLVYVDLNPHWTHIMCNNRQTDKEATGWRRLPQTDDLFHFLCISIVDGWTVATTRLNSHK